MGCGASGAIVDVCGRQTSSTQLRRHFSRRHQRGVSPQENGVDDLPLVRGCKLSSPSCCIDEEELSDITLGFSAQNSTSCMAPCASSLFRNEDLERRWLETPNSLEEDFFVYDDAVVPKNEEQAKHWRIEGRRPLLPSRSYSNCSGGLNRAQVLFVFTDFNVCVDEVELNVGESTGNEFKQRASANYGRQHHSVLCGITVTRTFSMNPNTVVVRLSGEEQTKRSIIYPQLRNFTVDNFIGHSARVKCISILPNGHSFVSCSCEDASVMLHNLRNGCGEGIFTGHCDTVICTAVSPDGKYLATTSKDHSMTLWDSIITKMLYILNHDKVVICCCFSPDSKIVASGCQDRVCRLWDVRQAKELLSYNQHGGIIVSLAFSPDGNNVCSTSADKTLRVWSARTGKTNLTLRGHSGIVLACSYSSNGDYIISNDETHLCVWRASDGTCRLRLGVTDVAQVTRGVKNRVRLGWTSSCAAPGVFARYAVAACTNRFVYIFDIFSGEECSHVFCKAPVYCLTSGAKNKIAFGDSFGNIYVQTLF